MVNTRASILEKNFEAIYQNGFQATRTDKVISKLGITKGAFYHYFPDKASMGYAIIDEIIYPMYVNRWVEAQNSDLPTIESIVKALESIAQIITPETVGMGCPLNNLVQEMSTIDETFRAKLSHTINTIVEIIAHILQKGIEKEEVNPTINPTQIASFIWASLEGSFGLGKVQNSLPAFQASFQALLFFIKSLKK